RHPSSTVFPYTTLFRSAHERGEPLLRQVEGEDRVLRRRQRVQQQRELVRVLLPPGEQAREARLARLHHHLRQRSREVCRRGSLRSEDHTSELQSLAYLV